MLNIQRTFSLQHPPTIAPCTTVMASSWVQFITAASAADIEDKNVEMMSRTPPLRIADIDRVDNVDVTK